MEVGLAFTPQSPCPCWLVGHRALTGHSAMHRAVTVHRDDSEVAGLPYWGQVCLCVHVLPEAAEPDTAGGDSTQQQQQDSEEDEPGKSSKAHHQTDPHHQAEAPWGQPRPVTQDRMTGRGEKTRECLSMPETSLARDLPALASCCWACPGCLSRAGQGWPWVHSQDTLSPVNCTILVPSGDSDQALL